ncbi:MAG: hypothetical protein ACON42_03255 [Flavobacteriaceae bacterium]
MKNDQWPNGFRMRITVFGLVFLSLVMFTACSSDSGGGTDDSGDGSTTAVPSAARLISPENQSLCLDGEEVTPVLSRVRFEWQAAENTQSYTLVVVDVENQQQQQSQLNGTNADLSLTVGKAYRWKVISRQSNSSATAESDSWVFYLEGSPTPNYAPFPASLNFPAAGQSLSATDYASIDFQWTGSDLDNDSLSYDLYTGTTTQTLTLAAEQLSSENHQLNGFSAGTYYWQVISRDGQGNQTASEIQGFVLY